VKCALSDGRKPDIHHSDQGVQYAATAYVNTLSERGIAISMAEVGQATQNPFAERVIRTIKEEEVYLSDYQNYQDAYHQIGRFIEDVYQHKRIHSALGYLTPAEFEAQWLETQTERRLFTKSRYFRVQKMGRSTEVVPLQPALRAHRPPRHRRLLNRLLTPLLRPFTMS